MDLNETIHIVGRVSSRLTDALIELEKLPTSPARRLCQSNIDKARHWISDPAWLTCEPTKEPTDD